MADNPPNTMPDDEQIKAWHEEFPERSIKSIKDVVYTQWRTVSKAKLRDEATSVSTY